MTQPVTRPKPKNSSHVESPATAPKHKVSVTAPATALKTKAPAPAKPPETRARTK